MTASDLADANALLGVFDAPAPGSTEFRCTVPDLARVVARRGAEIVTLDVTLRYG